MYGRAESWNAPCQPANTMRKETHAAERLMMDATLPFRYVSVILPQWETGERRPPDYIPYLTRDDDTVVYTLAAT